MNKWFLIFLILGFLSCKQETAPTRVQQQKLIGKTMGTYYSIKYNGTDPASLQKGIDSIFYELNICLSNYIPESQISKFNTTNNLEIADGPDHFKKVFDKSKEVYKKSDGAFDPTIMPLVNFWGFGYKGNDGKAKDEKKIDALLALVGFDMVEIKEDSVTTYSKKLDGIQLDFSALGKGYGVDEIGEFLEYKGIKDYLVEIGGEVRARGISRPGKIWTVGINSPKEGAAFTDVHTVVLLKDAAIASSGNYRDFYEVDGKKYAHTINPKTGRPELNRLLGASIIHNDCMTADAYATACMVLGPEKAFALVEKEADLEGFFIYSNDKGELLTKQTKGMAKYLASSTVKK